LITGGRKCTKANGPETETAERLRERRHHAMRLFQEETARAKKDARLNESVARE
jgi:hypothetical protein